jgi:hypothetical protein
MLRQFRKSSTFKGLKQEMLDILKEKHGMINPEIIIKEK